MAFEEKTDDDLLWEYALLVPNPHQMTSTVVVDTKDLCEELIHRLGAHEYIKRINEFRQTAKLLTS